MLHTTTLEIVRKQQYISLVTGKLKTGNKTKQSHSTQYDWLATIIQKTFETNLSFHVKYCTTAKI